MHSPANRPIMVRNIRLPSLDNVRGNDDGRVFDEAEAIEAIVAANKIKQILNTLCSIVYGYLPYKNVKFLNS